MSSLLHKTEAHKSDRDIYSYVGTLAMDALTIYERAKGEKREAKCSIQDFTCGKL